MFEHKVVKKANRLVWRMSPTKLAGEFVPAGQARGERPESCEMSDCGFRESSVELSHGTDVTEMEMDTLPGELVAAFLKLGR